MRRAARICGGGAPARHAGRRGRGAYEYEIEAELLLRVPAQRRAVPGVFADRRRRRERLRAALRGERCAAARRRPAADRRGLRARRLRLRHHAHFPGQRPLQRRRSARSTSWCSRRRRRRSRPCAPGAGWNEPHDAAVRVLAQGMLDLELLAGTLDEVLEKEIVQALLHAPHRPLARPRRARRRRVQAAAATGARSRPAWRSPSSRASTSAPADDVPAAFWQHRRAHRGRRGRDRAAAAK